MANTDGLNPDFQARVMALIGASGGRITITSGFRSVDEQKKLWTKAVNKYGSEAAARKWVAPPGSSNHNKGFAVDLGGDLKLAHRLAPQFGLHFPMGHEPWHVEPLGYRSKKDAYTLPPDYDIEAFDPNNPDSMPEVAPNPMAEFARLLSGAGLEAGTGVSGVEGLEQMVQETRQTAGVK